MINFFNQKILLPGVLLFLGLNVSAPAVAHDVYSGKSLAIVNSETGLTIEMHFAAVTVQGFMTDLSSRDNQVSSANFDNINEHLRSKARNFYRVTINGKVLQHDSLEIEVKDQLDAVAMIFHYPGPLEGTLGLSGEFIKHTNPEYQSTLTVLNEDEVQLGLFIQTYEAYYSEVDVTKTATKKPNNKGIFTRFLSQGVLHIVFGYDHLLFLIALLIVCRNWRPALIIITSFTAAHTITLSLAALNLLTPPAVLIEILIALTIIYVGVENLWSNHQPKVRWLLTAIFGLAHGFGFANMLRGLGLGAEGAPIALPLFAFNFGVEIGQLVLAALFLPLLWQARKYDVFRKFGLPAISIFVVSLGTFWAIERTLSY